MKPGSEAYVQPDILMILPDNDLVSDNRVKREARTLAAAGYRVTILARASRRAARPQLDPSGYRAEYLRRDGSDYLAGVAHRVRKIGGRVLHAHDWEGLLAAHLSRLGAPVVYDSHEYWAGLDNDDPRPKRWQLVETALAASAAAVITVSDGIADMLTRDLGLGERPVVLHNIPDHSGPGPAPRARTLRERIGVAPETPLAGFCGYLTAEGRGLDRMIASLAQATDWHLVFIGPSIRSTQNELQTMAERLGVAQRVHFVGEVPQRELLHLLADVDVGLCVPPDLNLNYRHLMPNKLFEYVAAGIGVIVTDLPDISRFVREHGVGVVVPPDGPDTLAEALRQWPSLRPSREALDRARQSVTWSREGKKLVEIYRKLIGPGQGVWGEPAPEDHWPEEMRDAWLVTRGRAEDVDPLDIFPEAPVARRIRLLRSRHLCDELEALSARETVTIVFDRRLAYRLRAGRVLRLKLRHPRLYVLDVSEPSFIRRLRLFERSRYRLGVSRWKRGVERELRQLAASQGGMT